jgi:putative copper export protein
MLVAFRGIYYTAVMCLFGDLAFSNVLRAKLPIVLPPGNNVLRWTSLGVGAAASCGWLVAAAAQMAGTLDRQAVVQTVTATLFGQLFLLRMLALCGVALALAARHGTRLAMPLVALALVLPAVTSHAAASSPAGFAILGATLDSVHLLTGGFWIGGLLVLAALFRRGEPNMLLALSLFSDWAMVAVLLLVMTGLIDAASILLGDKGTASVPYLAVLGVKLVLVAAMLSLAAFNRLRWMPRGREEKIARNVLLELGTGVIVVLLAGALGQLQPVISPAGF